MGGAPNIGLVHIGFPDPAIVAGAMERSIGKATRDNLTVIQTNAAWRRTSFMVC